MSDFRSLLSTFQAATGTVTTTSSSSSSNLAESQTQSQSESKSQSIALSKNNYDSSKQSIRSTNSTTGKIHPSLKQCTERLYQISNLRRLTTTSVSTSSTPMPVDTGKSEKTHVHIAICAVIVDSFPHEAIWKRWMDSGNPSGQGDKTFSQNDNSNSKDLNLTATSELYIHAKFPDKVSSPWVKSKTLSYSYQPNWNDVRVVRAMLALLDQALQDSRTTHVLFCTESCIPITSLFEAARTLILDPPHTSSKDANDSNASNGETKNETRTNKNECYKTNMNRSFIHAYDGKSPNCTRFDENNCWGVLDQYLPMDAIWKALPGWILLSRKHASAIQNIPTSLSSTIVNTNSHDDDNSSKTQIDLWPAFEKVWAPEEVYFPTALALMGHLPSTDVLTIPMTHSEWNTRAKDHSERAHPKVYDKYALRPTFLDRIRFRNSSEHGCLFMRKFKEPLEETIWSTVVLEQKEVDDLVNSRPNIPKKRPRYEDRSQYSHGGNGYRSGNYGDNRNRDRDWNRSRHHYNYHHHQNRSDMDRNFQKRSDRNKGKYNNER